MLLGEGIWDVRPGGHCRSPLSKLLFWLGAPHRLDTLRARDRKRCGSYCPLAEHPGPHCEPGAARQGEARGLSREMLLLAISRGEEAGTSMLHAPAHSSLSPTGTQSSRSWLPWRHSQGSQPASPPAPAAPRVCSYTYESLGRGGHTDSWAPAPRRVRARGKVPEAVPAPKRKLLCLTLFPLCLGLPIGSSPPLNWCGRERSAGPPNITPYSPSSLGSQLHHSLLGIPLGHSRGHSKVPGYCHGNHSSMHSGDHLPTVGALQSSTGQQMWSPLPRHTGDQGRVLQPGSQHQKAGWVGEQGTGARTSVQGEKSPGYPSSLLR